jgi:hypothetical protein
VLAELLLVELEEFELELLLVGVLLQAAAINNIPKLRTKIFFIYYYWLMLIVN